VVLVLFKQPKRRQQNAGSVTPPADFQIIGVLLHLLHILLPLVNCLYIGQQIEGFNIKRFKLWNS
jgi:hypothetical protein